MQYPDALLRSAALASRRDLQNRQVNENQDLFRDVAEEFNDWTSSSGGIVAPTDPIFELIETEEENRSGPITSAIVFAEWRDVVRLYSICVANWEASGKHNNHDFWRYCKNNVDVYYLHHWLKKIGNPNVSSFCAEGTVLPFGVDSGAPPPAASTASSAPSNPAPATRKRKGSETDSAVQDALLQRVQKQNKLAETMESVQLAKLKRIRLSTLRDCEDHLARVQQLDREAGIEEESERVQSAIVMLQDAQKDYEECVATIK